MVPARRAGRKFVICYCYIHVLVVVPNGQTNWYTQPLVVSLTWGLVPVLVFFFLHLCSFVNLLRTCVKQSIDSVVSKTFRILRLGVNVMEAGVQEGTLPNPERAKFHFSSWSLTRLACWTFRCNPPNSFISVWVAHSTSFFCSDGMSFVVGVRC